jgi:uncharacterized membrane protein YfcA
MIDDPLFYVLAVPAVILLGLAKGGFGGIGMLSLPMMALMTSPVRAAAIILPILIVQDVVSIWAYWGQWDRRNLAILIPSGSVGVVLGYLLAAWVSDAAVALAVGAISIVFAVRRLVVERRAAAPEPSTAGLSAGLLWGLASGFTSMIGHAGGPPFQIYVLPQRLQRDVFVGTGALFFAWMNLIKVPAYGALGQLGRDNLMTALVLFPVAIASTFAGVALVRRVSAERFYTVIYTLLICVGLKLCWDGAHGLFAP